MTIVKDGYPFILGSGACGMVWRGHHLVHSLPGSYGIFCVFFPQSKTRYGAGHFGNLFSGRRNGNGRGGFLR